VWRRQDYRSSSESELYLAVAERGSYILFKDGIGAMTRREWMALVPAATAVKTGRAADVSFERIDTHNHIHRSAPALVAAMERTGWRGLSICDSREVGDDVSVLPQMIPGTAQFHRDSKKRWERYESLTLSLGCHSARVGAKHAQTKEAADRPVFSAKHDRAADHPARFRRTVRFCCFRLPTIHSRRPTFR
jgi:hypothetical protein